MDLHPDIARLAFIGWRLQVSQPRPAEDANMRSTDQTLSTNLARLRLTALDLARRLNLKRYSRSWRGRCPCCIRIPEALRITGLSRSELYRAGRDKIVLLKCGKSTLVEFSSLERVVASLPRAVIKAS